MSEQNPYDQLGVTEDSSFDEIQEARDHLVSVHDGDRKQVETIEAAYDAILMDRLRMRQEGKIKVPDRIRFPEKLTQAPPSAAPAPTDQAPAWLQQLIDTPSRADIVWPAGLFIGLSALSISAPALALAVGVGVSLYFLNRKEKKFGRAILLTLIGLIIGIVVGLQIDSLFPLQIATIGLEAESFAAIVTFFILWLVSSFLR